MCAIRDLNSYQAPTPPQRKLSQSYSRPAWGSTLKYGALGKQWGRVVAGEGGGYLGSGDPQVCRFPQEGVIFVGGGAARGLAKRGRVHQRRGPGAAHASSGRICRLARFNWGLCMKICSPFLPDSIPGSWQKRGRSSCGRGGGGGGGGHNRALNIQTIQSDGPKIATTFAEQLQ